MFKYVKADVQRDGLRNTVITKERMKAFKQGIHLLQRKLILPFLKKAQL